MALCAMSGLCTRQNSRRALFGPGSGRRVAALRPELRRGRRGGPSRPQGSRMDVRGGVCGCGS